MRKRVVNFFTVFLLACMVTLTFSNHINSNALLFYGKVYGYVKDANNYAIKGIRVEARYGSTVYDSDYTDTSGYFELDVIAFGQTITVYYRAFHEKTTSFKIYPNQNYQKDMTIDCSYAILINGNNLDNHHHEECSKIFDDLKLYGFRSENIYFASYVSESGKTDRIISGLSDIYWAIDQVASKSTSSDQVFFYWGSHGGVNQICWSSTQYITPTQLNNEVDDITCKEMYIFFSACHSGSFIDETGELNSEPNRAILTACTSSEGSVVPFGWTMSLFGTAVHRSWLALYDAYIADTNDDYRVSLQEFHTQIISYVTSYTSSQHPTPFVGSLISPITNDYFGNVFYYRY